MRQERVNKEYLRRRIREATGIERYARRHDALVVGLQGGEAAHLALPEYVDDMVELQTPTGEFYYLPEYSLPNGPDIMR